jgi:hypothetical protein
MMIKVAVLLVKLSDTEEVLADFFAKVVEKDAMRLGCRSVSRVVRGKS